MKKLGIYKGWYWLIFFGVVILLTSCVSQPFYARNLRVDDGLTRMYKEAMVEIGEANGVDVSGMEVFLSDEMNAVVLLMGDGRGIVIDKDYVVWARENRPIIYSVMAHELAHKKLGHDYPGKEAEFEADQEAVRMLEKVGMWKDNYAYSLMMEKGCWIVNKDGGKYHPSLDERIKRVR